MCTDADPFVGVLREAASAVPVVTYGLYNRDADVSVERMRLNIEETQVRVKLAGSPWPAAAQLLACLASTKAPDNNCLPLRPMLHFEKRGE